MKLSVNNHIINHPDIFLRYLKAIIPEVISDTPGPKTNCITFELEFKVDEIATIIQIAEKEVAWLRTSEFKEWLRSLGQTQFDLINKAKSMHLKYEDPMFASLDTKSTYKVFAEFFTN